MKPYLSAALALVALVGCSSAKKPDGRAEVQRQLPLMSSEPILNHSNVSQFDGQVAIEVTTELVDGNTVVTISPVPSWPVQNQFLGFDHFYYNASCEHPIIEIKDEGCDEAVDENGEACGWMVNYDGCVADGFGCFISRKSNGPASHGATTQDLVFVLLGDATFTANNQDATFAVHGRFSEDCSAWFSDGTATSVTPNESCQPWPPRACTVSVDPSALALLLGGSGSATVTVDETGGQPPLVPIALSIDPASLPSGVSADLAPNPVNPPGTSGLTVQTTLGAPLGLSELIIVGTGYDAAGAPFQCRTTLELDIQEPPRTCTVSVDPSALELLLGGSASATVTVGETGEPLVPITLSIDPASLPSGVSVDMVPNPVNPPGTSGLTVQTTPAAPLGVSQLIVVGTGYNASGAPFQCRTTLSLDIREIPPPPVHTCSLSVDPSLLEVIRGSWAGATVTVGETGEEPLVPITLSIDPLSLPSGVTVGLAPNPVNPPGTSIMTVQTMATAPLGVFQIEVLGEGHEATGEPFQCRTTLELKIGEPPPQHGACYCPTP